MTTEAQARATKKYQEKMDTIRITIPRDVSAKFRTAAEEAGIPLSKLIRQTVEARIQSVDLDPVVIDSRTQTANLIKAYDIALEELIQANAAQASAQTKFLACVDALKKSMERGQ